MPPGNDPKDKDVLASMAMLPAVTETGPALPEPWVSLPTKPPARSCMVEPAEIVTAPALPEAPGTTKVTMPVGASKPVPSTVSELLAVAMTAPDGAGPSVKAPDKAVAGDADIGAGQDDRGARTRAGI